MKKYIIIIFILVFVICLKINFKEENTYNSYLRNMYYNFLSFFASEEPVSGTYSNLELENQELKMNISELKKMTEIRTVLAEYSVINASVISRSLVGWFNTLVIDKGANDGIEVGMCVTNNEALIGTIYEVMEETSIVRLITNNLHKVSAKTVGEESVYGLVYEYKDSHLLMRGLKNTNIPLETEVVTTGMSNIYPAGIFIGKVDEITYDEFELTPIMKIKTPVDFNNILYVSVLSR